MTPSIDCYWGGSTQGLGIWGLGVQGVSLIYGKSHVTPTTENHMHKEMENEAETGIT